MTREEKLKAETERVKLVKKWPDRLARLYKKKGMSEAEFCRAHDIPISRFNRGKNLESIPNEESVARVEAALKREGV